MADELDVRLSRLGRGTPFAVDWQQYESQVLCRLARAEARRRRRTWWLACAGAVGGAAAMWCAMALLPLLTPQIERQAPVADRPEPAPEPLAPRTAPVQLREQPSAPRLVFSRRGERGSILIVQEPAAAQPDEVAPFVRVSRREDGSQSSIRFDGFSEAGAKRGSLLVAVGHPRQAGD